MMLLSSLSSFCTAWNPKAWGSSPIFQVSLPTSVYPVLKLRHGYAQKFVCLVILDPTKVMIIRNQYSNLCVCVPVHQTIYLSTYHLSNYPHWYVNKFKSFNDVYERELLICGFSCQFLCCCKANQCALHFFFQAQVTAITSPLFSVSAELL